MSEAQARLVVQRGPDPGIVYILSQGMVSIGRSATNDIVINDPEMSRQHAQINQHGEGYALQDLGSTNGTFVNHHRVTSPVPLNHGDVIAFGEAIVLAYREESATDSHLVPSATISQPPPVISVTPTTEIEQPIFEEQDLFTPPRTNRRRWLLGCVVAFLAIVCFCMAALFFLDSYQQGWYLYCGWLRPFWELILGPFGFNPAC